MKSLDISKIFTPPAWDDVAEAYSEFIGGHLSRYAEDALTRMSVHAGERVLDVAAGPGTLSLPAARITEVHALDFSERMLAVLESRASEEEFNNLKLVAADGQALPFADTSFDVAFSMFGLFMFPNRALGFSEMFRVLKPGGRALVASWQPQDQVSAFALIGQALMEATGDLEHRGEQPLADPEELRAEMSSVGFEVSIEACTYTLELPDFVSMWEGISHAHVGLMLAKRQLSPHDFDELSVEIENRLRLALGEGPQSIKMPAWFAIGHKPK